MEVSNNLKSACAGPAETNDELQCKLWLTETHKLAPGYNEYFFFYFIMEESRRTLRLLCCYCLSLQQRTTSHDKIVSFDGMVFKHKKMYQCRRTCIS